MDYVSEAANKLMACSFSDSLLGPEVYTLIARWEKNEIPLAVVLASIEEYCGSDDDVRDQARSIGELSLVVDRNFGIWLADACP